MEQENPTTYMVESSTTVSTLHTEENSLYTD
jgi:hypothetical protein